MVNTYYGKLEGLCAFVRFVSDEIRAISAINLSKTWLGRSFEAGINLSLFLDDALLGEPDVDREAEV